MPSLAPVPILALILGSTILIRHDRPDAAYLELGERYGHAVAHVEERAEGTLVAPRWVLTAAHVIEASGPFDAPFVILGGERYAVEKSVLHPDWEGNFDDLTTAHDLALLKLDRPADGIEPVPLYRWDDELGQVAVLLGRGKTGDGVTGAEGEKGHVLRGATNQVAGVSDVILLTVFESPEQGATELEGAAAAGDSGGPAFLERVSVAYLAGVGSFGTAGRGYSAYGAIDGYVRVSSFRGWIEHSIASDAPATTTWSEPRRFDGWPATPAGRLAAGFFAAYASEEPGALEAFFRGVGDEPEQALRRATALRAAVREPLGALDVYGWADAGPGHVRVLVHSPSADAWRSLGFEAEVGGDDRGDLGHFYMKWESAPKTEVWR
jgi:hypothetical protein